MRALFQILLGIASLSFTPPAGAVDGDGSNVQVVVYEGPTECTDEDKILSGNYISIHFDGYIDESSDVGDRGTRFISSRDMNNNKTVDFQIGKKRVIEGWEKGLLGLCKGSSAMLVIPPDLVYGEMEGGPGTPSGATLLFNIEVIETSKSFRASTDPSMDSFYCIEDAEDGSLTSNQECSASSSMLSLAFEEEEDIGVATSFSVSARPKSGGKYNKRLKKQSKKKVQEYISYLMNPVWCRNYGRKERVEPRTESSYVCSSSCWPEFACGRCCNAGCEKEGGLLGMGGTCYCPSSNAYCPSGYSTDGVHSECHKCEMNPSKPPGAFSVGAEGAVSSGVTAQINGCPQGFLCKDTTVWCARKCEATFPQHCRISGTNYCAKSQEICNDKRWELFEIWGEFLLNFIPGGGQTVKAAAKAVQKGGSLRKLNIALRKVGRNAVKKMKKDFQKEISTLKKDLKNALKEEAESVIDGVIDDALEEMSLKASKDDQDTDELGGIVLEALGEFVTDLFSPFDFKGFVALMEAPQCGSYSISGTDLEWEDLPDGLENVALRKRAFQSTTSSFIAVDGSLAVDGNLDGDHGAGSVTHTNQESNPWWEVDLKKLYTIEYIHVYNREDCCKERLAGFTVSIYVGNTLTFSKTMPRNKTPDYETIIEVPKVQGNRVKVSLSGDGKILQLAEVEVIGKPS